MSGKYFVLSFYLNKRFYPVLTWCGFRKAIRGDEEAFLRKMNSSIKFTSVVSQEKVNFLDVTIKLANGNLTTTLYSKPTDAHTYLHNSSYHPWHLIRSIPKSQFIRIRRICTSVRDYKTHAHEFINHFTNRGYNKERLRRMVEDIAQADRDELLNPKIDNQSTEMRTPLVLTYHHKLKNISRIVHHRYTGMIARNPEMKKIFPEPPIVAYKRTKNLKDILTQSAHQPNHPPCKHDTTKIRHSMNTTNTISNELSGCNAKTKQLPSTTCNTICAGKCLKHNRIYIGQSGQGLNERYNGHHRSDLKLRPDRTELTQHFKNNNCNFEKDLQISILEKVKGGLGARLRREEQWIGKLNTIAPNGLNTRTNNYGDTYRKLFN